MIVVRRCSIVEREVVVLFLEANLAKICREECDTR